MLAPAAGGTSTCTDNSSYRLLGGKGLSTTESQVSCKLFSLQQKDLRRMCSWLWHVNAVASSQAFGKAAVPGRDSQSTRTGFQGRISRYATWP